MSILKFPNNGLTLVSLFAGCGGSSLGYKMAGYDIRLAVEWDKGAVDTYRDNFPETEVFQGDIATLSDKQACKLADVKPGELDVLDGSPPCQGFSTAGKRIMADGRNQIFQEYVRLLEAFKPKIFIMENVSGLIKGKMKLIFAKMTKALKASGYRVSCRLLNAWWYGVPQDRKRLIWIGIRNDLEINPGHPEPMQRKPISVGEALRDEVMFIRNEQFKNHWRSRALPAPTLEANEPPKVKEVHHLAESRHITIGEAKTLQGFPEWFQIEQYKYIGNSVAPPMAQAIGEHIHELLIGNKAVLIEGAD